MPNSANRSNGGGGNSNQGQPKHHTSGSSKQKDNKERSDLKHSDGKDQGGSTNRTSNQGHKRASGGSAD